MAGGGGGDKTEKATSKKRKDARNRGQVLKSTELVSALSLIVSFWLLGILWDPFMESVSFLFHKYFAEDFIVNASLHMNSSLFTRLFVNAVVDLAKMAAPMLLCAMFMGIITNYVQVGFLFTTSAIAPKFSKINPLSGFKRMFSTRSLMELAKSTLKIIVLGYLVYEEFKVQMFKNPAYMRVSIGEALSDIMHSAIDIAMKLGLFLLILSVGDYFYQWWRYEKDLMMSKQEVKDEHKMIEGNPEIKSKIRSKMRQMSAMRMMQSVPDADVVITNPTHYAVALKYDNAADQAPRVIAKGKDFLARKIKEAAAEHSVTMVENKPLAQSLYLYCEIGDEIPSDMYQAVADILVYIYKLKNRLK